LTCTTNPKAAVAGIATFAGCAIDNAGTSTLTATDGTLTSAISNSLTTTTGSAAKFTFTTSAVSGAASNSATLGPITVQAQDLGGNPVNAGVGGIAVTLTSNSTGTKIFAASSGGASVGSVTIPSGSSTVSFYYADTKAGSPVITASGTLTSATQTETITAAAVAGLAFTNSDHTLFCGTISSSYACTVSGLANGASVTANVSFVDRFGNPAVQSLTADSTINLSATPKGTLSPTSLSILKATPTSTGAFTLTKAGSNSASTTATFGSFSVSLTTN